jgi:hypothetical protein
MDTNEKNSKVVSAAKMSSFVTALIVSMCEDSKTLERFQKELSDQLAVRDEVKRRAEEILTGKNQVSSLAKVLEYSFTKEGKTMEFISKVPVMLKSLTGEKANQPFGCQPGRDGGTFLWAGHVPKPKKDKGGNKSSDSASESASDSDSEDNG